MDEIASKLKNIKQEHGPEAVAVIGGNTHEPGDWAFWRFCNLFGTPNYISQGRNCGVSEFIAECAVYGYHTSRLPIPGLTGCTVLWGSNPENSNQLHYKAMLKAQRQGMKLIVVDPRKSGAASQADLWLQLRPGTDGALSLAMLQVIIAEGLYDKTFVNDWCLGFDALKAYIYDFTPEKASTITRVPAEKIIQAARIYATKKPSIVTWGLATCHLGPAGKSAAQTKAILRAVTGNLDVEGGNVLVRPLPRYAWHENLHWDDLINHPERTRDNVSAQKYPITSVRGYRAFRESMKQVLPNGYGAAMYMLVPTTRGIWRAILEGNPYPVKAVFTQASNPLSVFAQPKRFYEAYTSQKLSLHVAMELFMTPTAQLADYILPAASWLERPHVKTRWALQDYYILGDQAVQPLFERRDDYHLWRELGVRLGQKKYWADTLEEMYDWFLKPSGKSFSDFVAQKDNWCRPSAQFKKWEKHGFATNSGKVELLPSIFKSLGIDSLPRYEEPARSPIRTPELAKTYPLILISGARVRHFTHSCYRQIKKLRKHQSDPLLEIHPKTAQRLNIREKEWVYVETPEGRIQQRARLTDTISEDVVHADAYWWYPERNAKAPRLYDAFDSNINAIIPDDPQFCDYAGNNHFRALLCNVYPVSSKSRNQ